MGSNLNYSFKWNNFPHRVTIYIWLLLMLSSFSYFSSVMSSFAAKLNSITTSEALKTWAQQAGLEQDPTVRARVDLEHQEAFDDETNQLIMRADVDQDPFQADNDSFLVAASKAWKIMLTQCLVRNVIYMSKYAIIII